MRCLASLLLLTLAGCAHRGESVNPDSPAVGLERLELTDPTRRAWGSDAPRPLVTSIWYPAPRGTSMVEIGIPPHRPIFVGGLAARSAPVRSGGPFPLIVMSHGTGAAGMQMMWLGRELAGRGYIVAAVDHHGNTAAETQYDPRGFMLPWERARDITEIINQLTAHPQFAPHIDAAQIGAVGFSLGGYTAVALAGGRTDLTRLQAFCDGPQRDATCDAQLEYPEAAADFEKLAAKDPSVAMRRAESEGDFSDSRIRSVVLLAPALGQAFSPESLANIQVPVLVIAGEDDRIAPSRTNAGPLAEWIPHAEFKSMRGANHYAFLNRCDRKRRRVVDLCGDGATPRHQVHAETIELVANHFATLHR
ncbi:MAG: alpha/beta fold hydrolase [Myxococcales bacterium FL481]|nr:MAG: alpha/beta fold hydrolase [Myxococcales bacterium FL481]